MKPQNAIGVAVRPAPPRVVRAESRVDRAAPRERRSKEPGGLVDDDGVTGLASRLASSSSAPTPRRSRMELHQPELAAAADGIGVERALLHAHRGEEERIDAVSLAGVDEKLRETPCSSRAPAACSPAMPHVHALAVDGDAERESLLDRARELAGVDRDLKPGNGLLAVCRVWIREDRDIGELEPK